VRYSIRELEAGPSGDKKLRSLFTIITMLILSRVCTQAADDGSFESYRYVETPQIANECRKLFPNDYGKCLDEQVVAFIGLNDLWIRSPDEADIDCARRMDEEYTGPNVLYRVPNGMAICLRRYHGSEIDPEPSIPLFNRRHRFR
jgi:hypothetical protein